MSSSKRARSRWIRRTVVLVLIGTAAGYFIWKKTRQEPPPPPQTVEVTRGDIEETVLATGELEAFRLVSVGAQATGRIESMHVELGDEVKAGDPIAEIDSLNQQNALRNAEASLANIKAQKRLEQANLKQAQQNYERQKKLFDKGAGSAEELEAADATLEVTKAQIDAIDAQIAQAEIAVDTATVNLGYTKITAPMDGVVVALVVEEGQTVNAAQSAPTIIKLANLDTMTVSAEISEADVTRVSVGQPVYFTILGEPDHKYHSTLRTVEPAPESIQTETATSSTSSSDTAIYYNAQFDVQNPDHKLRISMTAEVSVVLASSKDTVLIPASSVNQITPDGRATVGVMSELGTVEPREIRTGITDGVHVEVLDGLREGDRIVTSQHQASAPTEEQGRRRMGPPGPMGF